MNIAALSDIHSDINGVSTVKKCFKNMEDYSDCMVIAGDLANSLEEFKKITDLIMNKYTKPIFYVCGNHDFYDTLEQNITVYQKIELLLQHTKDSNFHILQNDSYEWNGYKFYGATLWTDYSVVSDDLKKYVSRALNDFKYINYDNGLDTYDAMCSWMTKEYNNTLDYFRKNINNDEKNILITHHGLSKQSISERFIHDKLNVAYCSDNDDFYRDVNPLYHFHGHVHTARKYKINKTQIVVHPMGYIYYDAYPNNNFTLLEI